MIVLALRTRGVRESITLLRVLNIVIWKTEQDGSIGTRGE